MRQVVVCLENKQSDDERFEELVNVYREAFRPRYFGSIPKDSDFLVIADFGETDWDSQELAEYAVLGLQGMAEQEAMLGTHIALTNVPEKFLGQILRAAELYAVPLLFCEQGQFEVLWPRSADPRLREAYDCVKTMGAAACTDVMQANKRSPRVSYSRLKRLRGYGLLYIESVKGHRFGPGRPRKMLSVMEGAAA